jgi:hypothetical protein
VALACKRPLNARLATAGLSFFPSTDWVSQGGTGGPSRLLHARDRQRHAAGSARRCFLACDRPGPSGQPWQQCRSADLAHVLVRGIYLHAMSGVQAVKGRAHAHGVAACAEAAGSAAARSRAHSAHVLCALRPLLLLACMQRKLLMQMHMHAALCTCMSPLSGPSDTCDAS